MYRPPNWKKFWDSEDAMLFDEAQIYEAGADAMLKALKENGKFTYGCHIPEIELEDAPDVSGYWVFIPED